MTQSIKTQTSAAKIYSRELKKDIPIPDDDFALMDEVAAAAYLNVGRRALQGWRISGNGPKYVRISSRCIRYRKANLIEWSKNRLQTSTSQDKGGRNE